MKMNQLHCQKCGYDWISRVPKPKVCPACHCRKWRKGGK